MSTKPKYVVGIGASAGGLNALEQFFDNTPPDTGMAFVVIQHLSPDFKSLMDDLLSRHTEMPIHRVTNGIELLANNVYLIPPKTQMTVREEKLFLTEKVASQHVDLPIDVFFRSLAQDQREFGIGIVLSGTGSDGSRGIIQIHDGNGLVMVQSPESAQFDGMPRNAITTGKVHFILPPEKMARVLIEYAANPVGIKSKVTNELTIFEDEGEFAEIFALLRRSYNLDFSKYKMSTVNRRITRRMEFRQIPNVSDYAAILVGDHNELDLLYKDLLIGVTEFFRDKQVFGFMSAEVVPHLFNSLMNDDEGIRVWSAGCATGEEAYSLAILLAEHAEKIGYDRKITVFATDVHKSSLETASQGLFGVERLENVSQERLDRYFKKESDNYYRVSNDLRKTVVFAPHNLLSDPPFTKIDLICCRNLLIYFQPQVQDRVISLFHFALKKDGILFLGSSEGLGSYANEFEVVANQHKLFRKIRDLKLTLDLGVKFTDKAPSPAFGAVHSGQTRLVNLDRQLLHDYDTMLKRHVPPGALVNENRQIVHFFGNVADYLNIEGRVGNDVLQLAKDNLHIALSTTLQRAERTRQSVVTRNVHITKDGEDMLLDVAVDPIPDEKTRSVHYHIYFARVRQQEQWPPSEAAEELSQTEFNAARQFHQHVQDLETELQSTRENLQATIEELQTTNEELQATNEELLAANEELQSTNEELHSVNEELYSVNTEFERKNLELKQLNKDYDNLLASTNIGTVFLDREMRIRKFNPAINRFFKLLPQDVGRPIDHIAYHLTDRTRMFDDIKRTIESGEVFEREVQADEKTWLLNRVAPFKTETGQVEGAVLTFTDITIIKRAEQAIRMVNEELELKVGEGTERLKEEMQKRRALDLALRESLEKYKAIFSTCPIGITVCDKDGRIIESNSVSERLLGLSVSEHQKRSINSEAWRIIRPDGTLMASDEYASVIAMREHRLVENVEMGIVKSDDETTWLNVSAAPIDLPNFGVAIAYADITEQKRAEAERLEIERRFLQGQKLESLGALTGGIAHDFNNLLMIINGNLEMMRDGLGEESMLLEYAGEMGDACRRAAELTQQMLAYSGKAHFMTREIDLNDLVRKNAELIRSTLPRTIALAIECAPNLPQVMADKGQMHQIIINLLTNAAEAIGEVPGTVTLKTGCARFDAKALAGNRVDAPVPEGDYVFIEVADTGCGMDEEILSRIFEPFYSTKFTGRGLGMSAVLGIVKAHHGALLIDTEQNVGSTFKILFPAVAPHPIGSVESAARENDDDINLGSGTILVVDDDDSVRRLCSAQVKSLGLKALTASDGEEALEIFKARGMDISLVILDLSMPKIDGVATLEEMRRLRPGVPVLITSGYSESTVLEQFIGEQPSGFIQKPFETATLAHQMALALSPEENEG